MKWTVIALALCAVAVVAAEKATFDNYRVYRVTPATEQNLKSLKALQDTNQFDIWNHIRGVNKPVDVMVPPHKRAMFSQFLLDTDMHAHVMIENLQQLVDDTTKNSKSPKAKLGWTDYYPLEDLYSWLDDVAANHSNVKVIVGGTTYEKREIRGIQITNGANLPGVILESGIHAREWIGPAASSWIVDKIVNSAEGSIWRKFNYIYFPSVNPDGYAYTWSDDRMWRKTRRLYGGGCVGADPNRNYGYHWMDGGSSSSPCSETFAGPTAFSEVETKTMSDFLTSVSSKFPIHLAFHSYSQLMMFPWGYTATHTPMHATWQRIADKAIAAIEAVHGTSFEAGDIYETIYQTSGTSTEWYYGATNATIAYTWELRDTGEYGFILPPKQIIPVAEEMIAGVQVVLEEYQKL